MITREEQYDWAVKRVKELLPLVNDDTPLDAQELIELELLSNLVADHDESNYSKSLKATEPLIQKLNPTDFLMTEELMPHGRTIHIPMLNDDIPDEVSMCDLEAAADSYEQADIVWKESCKRRDQGVKEDAGDHLYRLVRGLLKRGAFYTGEMP